MYITYYVQEDQCVALQTVIEMVTWRSVAAEVSRGPTMIPRCRYLCHLYGDHVCDPRVPFRRRYPLRNCIRHSASSRRPCAAPNAVNPRHNGAFRCLIRYSGSPASTCWRDVSFSGRHRRHPTAVAAPWLLLPVAFSCALCACFGTRPWPANRDDVVII